MLVALAFTLFAPADLVVENAMLWTDGVRRAETWIAVRDGRFVHVGERRADLVGPNTTVVNAKGRMVIPGLIDSHTHLLEGGVDLANLQLREATSKSDFIRRVKEWNAKLPKGQWLLGTGWSAESWPGQEQPTKQWLDPVTGDRPAVLTRMDGHSMIVNSAALKAAGITKDGPANPAGGVIDRDPTTGEPTGMLRETAMRLIQVPAPTPEQIVAGLQAAVREANKYGVTAVSEVAGLQNLPVYRRYATGPKPTMRFALYGRAADWPEAVRAMKSFAGVPGWAEARGLKAFMDGSLGSRTAYMHEPFLQQPMGKDATWRGAPRPGALDGTYRHGFRLAADANLQVIVHAIGDQANHDLLEMYSEIPGIERRRFRIEHVQHLLPQDIARFSKLGVVPSMQPFHKADDGRYCDDVIGPERSKTSYTFRSLLASGAKLAFGSDWDVVTIDPFAGIDTAVTGRILTGKIWMPQENITLDQALTCYTANGAYASFRESEIGSIRPGFYADFVILNQQPKSDTKDYRGFKPAATYVGGMLAAGRAD